MVLSWVGTAVVMATSSMEGEVVKCGYLTKSPSSGGRGRFKRRWFVLTDSRQLDSTPSSGNGASASSRSSFRFDYYEKENHIRKGNGSLCYYVDVLFVNITSSKVCNHT